MTTESAILFCIGAVGIILMYYQAKQFDDAHVFAKAVILAIASVVFLCFYLGFKKLTF